ncbi:MAG: hypothetical protein ACYCZY_03565 [Lacisediminihabitans sp.]
MKPAVLDNGEDAVALASGVAALHGVFFTFLAARRGQPVGKS